MSLRWLSLKNNSIWHFNPQTIFHLPEYQWDRHRRRITCQSMWMACQLLYVFTKSLSSLYFARRLWYHAMGWKFLSLEIGALMEQLQEKYFKINTGPYICVAAFTSLDIWDSLKGRLQQVPLSSSLLAGPSSMSAYHCFLAWIAEITKCVLLVHPHPYFYTRVNLSHSTQ